MKHLRNLNYETDQSNSREDTLHTDASKFLAVYPYCYYDAPTLWTL